MARYPRLGVKGVLIVDVLACGGWTLPNEPVTQAAAEASEPLSSGEILQVLPHHQRR